MRFSLFELEFNDWNGFVLRIGTLELFDECRSMFGLNIAPGFVLLELFYIDITLYHNPLA